MIIYVFLKVCASCAGNTGAIISFLIVSAQNRCSCQKQTVWKNGSQTETLSDLVHQMS